MIFRCGTLGSGHLMRDSNRNNDCSNDDEIDKERMGKRQHIRLQALSVHHEPRLVE